MDNQDTSKTYTYYFEDYTSDQISESLVGRKGLSLFKMHESDIPVPDFFVISSEVFSEYIQSVLEHKSIREKGKLLEKRDIKDVISRTKLNEEIEIQIKREYAKLSGFIDTWVSIRSSVVFPDKPEVSFSGVFNTRLNVRGIESLVKAIKDIYVDFFSESVLQYCLREEIEMSDVKLAIVVQKMVQSEVSGVCYTVDPITQDNMRMSIEAVYGLGDVISNGEITPDSYVLNKKDLSVFEKHIAPQEWMKIRSLSSNNLESSEKIQISSSWSHKQKLDDNKIVDVAKISLILEERLGKPQDVEWVYAGGKIWALQTKNSYTEYNLNTAISYGYGNFVSDSLYKVTNELLSRNSYSRELVDKKTQIAAKSVLTTLQEKVAQSVKKEEVDIKVEEIVTKVVDSQKEDRFITSGIGASFGTVTGNIVLVKNSTTVVEKGSIVVVQKYTKELYPVLLNASAVITEIGGLTSDIAITCRELNIPAVVGVKDAMTVLNDSMQVKVDGNSGNIYLVSTVDKDQGKIVENIVIKLNEKENIQETQLQEQTVKTVDTVVKDNSLPNTATKIYSLSNNELSSYVNADGLLSISLDELMIKEERHPLAFIEDGKYKEYADKIAIYIDKIAENVSPDEVIITIGDNIASSFRKLVKGKELEEIQDNGNVYGAYRLLNSPKLLDVALRIIKRVRNVYKSRNVSLAINSPMNANTLRELKKTISSMGLRRTNSFNIYITLENTSEVLLLDEILGVDIDGVIINTDNLAKSIMGVSRDETNAIIDMNSGSIVKVFTDIIKLSKSKGLRVIVAGKLKQDTIKLAVKLGAYGVTVQEEEIKTVKGILSQEEVRMILG